MNKFSRKSFLGMLGSLIALPAAIKNNKSHAKNVEKFYTTPKINPGEVALSGNFKTYISGGYKSCITGSF